MFKNKKLMGLLALLLAALTLSALLVACGGGEEPEDTTGEQTEETTTAIPENLFDFFGGAPEEYSIIYPGTAGSTVKNAAKAMTATLNYAYDLSLQMKGDNRVEQTEGAKEILIGLTNRQESIDTQKGITEKNDFVIRLEGNTLIIVGGNHEGTARGVEYFLDTYVNNAPYASLMIDKELDLYWTYREECASLYELAENYKVIVADRAASDVKILGKNLATELSDLTGKKMASGSDMVIGVSATAKDYVSSDKEILLGLTNRLESNQGEELTYMDYEIRYTENKIVLRGGSMEALRRAVRALVEEVSKGHVKDLTDSANSTVDRFFDASGAGSMVTEFDSFTPSWASDYQVPAWMTDLDEKIVALTAMNGRNMSASRGGDGVNYPAYSAEAIASAIKAGVDVIVLNLQETADGVLVVFPTEELSIATNADTMGGVAGLPVNTLISAWSYEDLTMLRFKDSDGKATDNRILTLYEAVALCKDRCFVTVNAPESEYNVNEIMFDILEEHDAFLSYYVPDPSGQSVAQPLTMDALVEFSKDSAKAAKALQVWRDQLFDAQGNQRTNRCARKLFTNRLGENADAWQRLREEWMTLLYTSDPVTYCRYIASLYPSALISTETITSNKVYTVADEQKLDGRVMIFSDPHYFNRNNRYGEDKTDSNNDMTIVQNQIDQMNARLAILVDMIADEYNGRGLDAVLILGDLSTDNNSTLMPQKLNTDYYKQFYNKLRQGLSEKGINNLPIYCVAGNHDSILNDEWKSVMGYDRQYSFAIGNTVFMMLDTFHEDGTADNYGAEYKGVDYAWIEAELKKYDNIENRRVVYCSHAFSGNEYKTLANTYTDSMLFMAGHSHMYTVEEINSHATYINVGGFSYTAFTAATGPNWDFGYLDLRTLWGYQILEWNEDVTYTYHVSIAHEYFATNMYYVLTEDIKTKDLVLRQKEN